MRRVSVPGKVILAGEYAVLEPGFTCLVAAVDRRLTVEAKPAAHWSVDTGRVRWTEGQPVPPEVGFVAAAIDALKGDAGVLPAAIRTSDDLHAGDRKLGLGGSAAVTVGTVAVLLPEGTPPASIARRAWQIHRAQQGGRGSGADVAASASGGVIHFGLSRSEPPSTVPGCSWTNAPRHPDVHLDLVWTGTSVKTSPRLQVWSDFVRTQPEGAARFCRLSEDAVFTCSLGLQFAEGQQLRAGIRAAREALQLLERELGLELETPAIKAAVEAAWGAGACGKLSGAGGGDCAIVLSVGERQREAAGGAVRAQGLEVIPVEWADEGIRFEVAEAPEASAK
jgi:phosphomevalonate kinase